jgi:hypothetical protein
LTVYLPKEIHQEIRKAAKRDRHSMSTQIVIIIEEIMKEAAHA